MKNLAELFTFVLENYINGNVKTSKTEPTHDVLIHQIPDTINALFYTRNDILITGSDGKGQKTDYPWVAIFNKKITTSATRGLYIVYLFKSDMSGFYITLNQGITYFKKSYGRKKYESARKVANYFKNEIGDTYFDKGDIDLVATRSSLGYGYQETNIISKYYKKGSFDEKTLVDDLNKMIAIYDELVDILGENNYEYNDAINKIINDDNDVFEPADEAIEDIKSVITSPTDINIVRNLKYVEPKEKRTKRFAKIRNSSGTKKTDYIEKAKSDTEVGLLGEMLALSYERERLIRDGYPELADKVQHVSVKSDAYGYDIISYELIGLKMTQVFIEVKTTTNKLDVDFPVSKNEVLTSNEKKDRYCIFRIYDVKNVNPSFYKVFGKIEDHFELDPVSYLARYVGPKK